MATVLSRLRPTARVRTAFAALRHENFRRFLGGQFISLCGTWMQTVAHGWLILTLTDSPFVVGLVSTLGSLPILLFTLYGGILADRVDKHRFILLLQWGMLAEAVVLGVLAVTGLVTVPWIIALATFFGLLTAFEVPTRQAFVAELVERQDLMNAIALGSTAFNVARVVGPVVAGVLLAVGGPAACFFANAASYVAVIVSLRRMRLPPNDERPKGAIDLAASFREGLRYVRRERWPRATLLLTAVFALFGFPFMTMLPVYARDALDVGASGYGALVSSVGIGAAGGALFLASTGRPRSQARIALASAALFGGALLFSSLLSHFVPAVILFAACGLTMGLHGITSNTLLQRQAPDHLRGRVMGFYSFMVLGLAPFGALQVGWVAEHQGVRAAFFAGGAVCMVAAAGVSWMLAKSARR